MKSSEKLKRCHLSQFQMLFGNNIWPEMWTPWRSLFESPQCGFLWWVIRLLRKGFDTPLEEIDLRHNPIPDNSQSIHFGIEQKWKEILARSPGEKNTLLWVTLKSFKFVIIICAVVRILDTCFLLTVERVLLGKILQRLVKDKRREEEYGDNNTEFEVATLGFILLSLSRLILGSIYYYTLEGVGRKMRIGLTSLVYSKVLRLSQNSLKEMGAGGLINLVSNDGAKLDNSYEILTVFIGPLQLCSLTWIVWMHFGVSSISGLVTIVMLGLGQSYMGKIGSDFRKKVAAASSHRVKLITQIVSAIRTIKMYAWEGPFETLVGKARRKEIDLIRQSHFLRTIGWCLYSCTSTLSMFSTIIVYLGTGNSLTAEKVFVCTMIYQNIGMVLNIDFPKGLAQMGIFMNTMTRFQDVLLLEEFESSRCVMEDSGEAQLEKNNSGSISLEKVTVLLKKATVLSNVSLEMSSFESVAIVGSVGCGKSTFLNMILNECPVTSGKVKVSGRVAYAPQQAWVFGGTIRENILFGSAFNARHYESVIYACALAQDLNDFPEGDKTLVAEGGVSLSGGQKARVSLARAVYADADIYLLDDTLSAVDQKVGQHILNFCIHGLLQSKLCILVTHQLQFLPESTRILRIEGGSVSQITVASHSANERSPLEKYVEDDKEDEALRLSNKKYFDDLNGNSSNVLPVKSDRVPLNVYQYYFSSDQMSFKYFTVFFFFTLISQVTQAGESYFLKFSVTKESGFDGWSYGAQLSALLTVIFLVVFTAAQHSSSFLRIIHFNGARIYNGMFKSVLNAPLQFFTDNSAGHIIERFARDTFMLDEVFPFTIFYASHILQKYLMSLFLFVASSFNFLILLPSIFLLCGVYLIQQFQIRSCRSLNRLEVSARNPITSHLNSTFHGLPTIHAFGREEEMEKHFRMFLDSFFWINFTKLSVISLTSAAIDFISLAFVNFFILVTMFSSGDGGDLGYGIAPLIALTHAIGWATSQFHVIETQAKSVESILEFVGIESEGFECVNETNGDDCLEPPPDWPWKGKITFDDVSLTHGSGRSVLKNISCTIMPGEKIGIIGRTGSGKSSLVSALFRLPEPSGEIWIDGVEIRTLSLRDLRPRISIIPQDPVLFEGTVRTNLDPFSQFPDAVLLESLKNVSLSQFALAKQGLNSEIQDGGKNLSVGERQLICMARALLRKNKILVLDEATANVDEATSLLIHDKINEVFANCTVLTIQHRLTSIMEYDKVIVMNNGEITEFDTPENLLADPRSYLKQRMSDSHRRCGT